MGLDSGVAAEPGRLVLDGPLADRCSHLFSARIDLLNFLLHKLAEVHQVMLSEFVSEVSGFGFDFEPSTWKAGWLKQDVSLGRAKNAWPSRAISFSALVDIVVNFSFINLFKRHFLPNLRFSIQIKYTFK